MERSQYSFQKLSYENLNFVLICSGLYKIFLGSIMLVTIFGVGSVDGDGLTSVIVYVGS